MSSKQQYKDYVTNLKKERADLLITIEKNNVHIINLMIANKSLHTKLNLCEHRYNSLKNTLIKVQKRWYQIIFFVK